ncbi:MAG: SDR family oxidoreductase [Anaerolineales bacterium]|nr:SDR family oxidoreductase [Anaerolineales bacterium]
MRILITGASGLLGINLALEAAKEHTVFGQVNSHTLSTTAFETRTANLLAPGETIHQAVKRLLDETQPDWVIHCAALANLDACEADPAQAYQLNTEVPAILAAHVARGGARMLHVSTDAVFDGQRGNYTEEDAPHPLSVYARTKLEGERRVLQANPQAIVARVNLFGWSLTGKRSLGEFFFNNLQAGRQVKGFIDVFFCPLLANDLAHIFLSMLALELNGLYHVVSSQCLSKYDFGVAIARRFGFQADLITPTTVDQAGLAAARSPNLTLDTHKLSTVMGQPLPTLSAGLDRFYTLYQQGYPQFLAQLSLAGG